MKIQQIREGKERYMDLLLLADEQPEMVERYLSRGEMYVLGEPVRALCVVTDEGSGVLELKNLAVSPSCQRQGYGRQMVKFLCERYRERFHTLLVGTGEAPGTLTFYRKCGFTDSHRVLNFFTEHYDHPIVEDGVLLRDMIYLHRTLEPVAKSESNNSEPV